jgi:uncharacterized phage-associated protein
MELHNIYREKLLNAILYFCKHTSKTSKLKVFKLLFFLDFTHFKETGRSVTNLDYYAWDLGPIPLDFFKELKEANGSPDDFKPFLTIYGFESEFNSKKGELFAAKKPAQLSVFSPREQRIIKDLCFVFKDVDAGDMSEISHLKNAPWHKTKTTKGLRGRIDYLLALDQDAKISKEDAIDALRERREMLDAFPPSSRLAHEG